MTTNGPFNVTVFLSIFDPLVYVRNKAAGLSRTNRTNGSSDDDNNSDGDDGDDGDDVDDDDDT